MMSSSSGRLNSPGTIAPVASDVVDFGYAPMHSSYTNFDPAPLLQQHHLYDSFDYTAANAFQFQDPFALFSSGSPPTNQLHQPFAPQIIMPPMAPSSLLQAPTTMTALPGVPSVVDTYQQHTFMGGGGGGFLKREGGGLFFSDTVGGDGGGRIGLNLGRRTYFSPADVLAVDRLLMRSRLGGMGVLGLGLGAAHHPPPRCQAEGCKADLSAAKHYHRRHKVCEYHAKAATVAASGKQQRFCQQCSRFHVLAEFDEAKRSCRKRLTEHNRRRRKPAGEQGKDTPPPSKKADTSSYNGDHRTTKSSTAAVAVSPTTSGFSCLQQQQELDNGGKSSNTATAPTALSLAAPPLPVHGRGSYVAGLDTMLLHQQGRDEREQGFMMTSLMQSHQQQRQRDSGNILSCSTTSASDQRHQNDGDSCCNGDNMQHFFEVDFM
ncbi:unnamed protein product [Alopecurus aequalis]